jgi:hypothetical protein
LIWFWTRTLMTMSPSATGAARPAGTGEACAGAANMPNTVSPASRSTARCCSRVFNWSPGSPAGQPVRIGGVFDTARAPGVNSVRTMFTIPRRQLATLAVLTSAVLFGTTRSVLVGEGVVHEGVRPAGWVGIALVLAGLVLTATVAR